MAIGGFQGVADWSLKKCEPPVLYFIKTTTEVYSHNL